MEYSRKRKIDIILFFMLVLCFFPIFFISCAAPKIKISMLVPAKAHEAATLRRIAVLPFSGQDGYQVSAEVEALLVNIQVDGKPYFRVIDRISIKKILKEHFLHMSGLVDEKTAVNVGKLVGAEGIISGTISKNIIEDKSFFETHSKCLAWNDKGRCVKRGKHKVRCIERDVYFSFTPKIIRVTTGEIVASKSLSGHSYDKVCRDSEFSPKDITEMLASAKLQALNKLRVLITPNYKNVEITLLDKDDTKPPSEVKEKIARGIDWAKQDRMDRACELWHDAYKLHPEGYAIHYLLGVCAETTGRSQKALSYYEKADKTTEKPIKEINEALTRVRVQIENQKKLEEQLRKIKKEGK